MRSSLGAMVAPAGEDGRTDGRHEAQARSLLLWQEQRAAGPAQDLTHPSQPPGPHAPFPLLAPFSLIMASNVQTDRRRRFSTRHRTAPMRVVAALVAGWWKGCASCSAPAYSVCSVHRLQPGERACSLHSQQPCAGCVHPPSACIWLSVRIAAALSSTHTRCARCCRRKQRTAAPRTPTSPGQAA